MAAIVTNNTHVYDISNKNEDLTAACSSDFTPQNKIIRSKSQGKYNSDSSFYQLERSHPGKYSATKRGLEEQNHLEERSKIIETKLESRSSREHEIPDPKLFESTKYKKNYQSNRYPEVQYDGKHSQSPDNFQCSVCGKIFLHKKKLMIHSRVHLGVKPLTCPFCTKRFGQKSHLNNHLMTHSKEKPFECDFCGNKYPRKDGLTVHIYGHLGHKNLVCSICSRGFTSRACLRKHVLTHCSENRCECQDCRRQFRSTHSLQVHIKYFSKRMSGLGKGCGRAPYCFKRNPISVYECDYCQKVFKNRHHHETHMLIHTKQRPYKCQICEQAFSQLAHVIKHQRRHTGERPYACQNCSKRFIQRHHLTYHINSRSCRKVPCYSCQECGKRYYSISELFNHAKDHNESKNIFSRIVEKIIFAGIYHKCVS